MKKFVPLIIATLAGVLLLSGALFAVSCTPPTPPTPQPGSNLTGINRWMYDRLRAWYYWDDALRTATIPGNYLPYDQFLHTMVVNAYLNGAHDDTEDPPTIDGYYTANQARRYYSHISRSTSGMTRAGTVHTTFGLMTRSIRISNTTRHIIVMMVNPGSPAALAGLKRGTRITMYAGMEIGDVQYNDYSRVLTNNSGTMPTLTDSSGATYNLTAAVTEVTPIITYKVLTTTGGKKVGYLLYNSFVKGPSDNDSDDKYNQELIRIFREFKTAAVTEMVLDLRYNGGGDVSCCQLLTSLMGNVTANQVFGRFYRNKNINAVYRVDNPEIMNFDQTGIDNGLRLSHIYVLATANSASASELTISSLRGILGNPARGADDPSVFHIGDVTNGKNVGMDVLTGTIDGYDYEFLPITFKIRNANGFCDYSGGFTPNQSLYEGQAVIDNPTGGVIYDFGDPNELLLAAALARIDGATPAPAPAPRSRWASEDDELLGLPQDPHLNGLLYYHD